MNYIIETDNLSKTYGRKKALDNVSIHIGQGDIYGLVGRNGAGKTTFMKILCGLIKKSGGSYSIFGKSNGELGSIMQRMGLLIEAPGIFGEYDAYTNLKIKCSLLGIRGKEEPERLLKLVGLESAGKKKAKHLTSTAKKSRSHNCDLDFKT